MQDEMMRGATQEEIRLMDEAVARAVALGRPFEEQEVFAPAWELGYELYPALDQSRFQLYQEARWKGRGDKKQFISRQWVVRTESKESDERAAFLDSLRNGDFAVPELETTIATRRLSVRTSAQVNRESGELETCNEDGIRVYDVEEALEMLELLYQERDTLYALAHQGERS